MDVLPKLYYGDITLTSCKWIESFILETFTETFKFVMEHFQSNYDRSLISSILMLLNRLTVRGLV